MKQAKIRTYVLILAALFCFTSCGTNVSTTPKEPEPPVLQEDTASDPSEAEPGLEADASEEPQSVPDLSEVPFSAARIAPYTDEAYVIVNGNLPYFSQQDLTTQSYEVYSQLDELGRCGTAYANIGPDLMPTEERGAIGEVKPSGWHTVKYDIVDGNYLYNRCHLIGYQLSGENANEKNLITGTRYLNVQGMLPFENMVADYVKETGNHVLYRVTPIYEGSNLLASGVLMEAESVEDQGADILFCVYVYNVQPGIAIDYATGESALAESDEPQATAQLPENEASADENGATSTAKVQAQTPEPPAPAAEPEPEVQAPEPEPEPEISEPVSQGTTYILNTNTKKFHVPSCSSIKQMKESNKEEYTGSREDVIARGYDPCKKCHP